MAARKPKSNRKPKAGDTDYQIDRYYQMYYGSDSQDGPQPSKAELNASKAETKRQKRMFNQYMNDLTSSGKLKAKYAKNVKSPGRAQPKGTQPKGMASPPRTGPSSGGGGQSARYNRLTGGGLNKHGR
jgi:hypothetical protein